MIDPTRTWLADVVAHCPNCEGPDVQTTYRDNETRETYSECAGCLERSPVKL